MWQQDELLSKEYEKLSRYKFISFDIFDTLILRMVDKPQDLFKKLGEECLLKGYLHKEINEYEFKEIRKISQAKARNNSKRNFKEINLEDIYNEMPSKIGNMDKIKELEIELEVKYSYINPVTYSLLKKLKKDGKKIFLISDMYLSKQQIKHILINNGFDYSLIEDLFVSSDVLLNKSEGKLFEYVLDKYNIFSNDIIHIGDNYYSDIQGAQKVHIDTVQYNIIEENDDSIEMETYKYGETLPEIKSLRKLAKNLSIEYSEKEKFWFQFGASIIGPVLCLFSQYVLDQAKNINVKTIKPFMREAVILEPLLKREAEYMKYDCDINALYISRIVALIASIGKITIDKLDSLFDIRNIKLKDVLNALGLSSDNVNKFNCYLDKYSSEINKDELVVISEYIIDNYKDKINKYVLKKREILIKYLFQEKCNSDKLLTVDLGVRGTVQEKLEKLLVEENIENDILNLFFISSDKLYPKIQEGVNIKTFVGIYDENIELVDCILDKLVIIEELMMDNKGSTVSYEQNGCFVKPILENNRIPEEEFIYKDICRQGMLKFQELYHKCFNNKKFIRKIYTRKKEVLNVLARLVTVPSYDESLYLLKLSHENGFGSTTVEKILKDSDIKLLEILGNNEFLIKAKLNKVIWPEAVVTLKNPIYIKKNVIRQSANIPRYYGEILSIVDKIKNDNVKDIIIWGAGDIGRICLDVLTMEKINVLFIIDRKEWLWGSRMKSVEINSSDYVKEKMLNRRKNILIGSFSFIDEIEKQISEKFNNYNIYKI